MTLLKIDAYIFTDNKFHLAFLVHASRQIHAYFINDV